MATTQTIQIKRSTTTNAPSSLAAGELAYSSASGYLYIGHPDGSTGPIAVGGDSQFAQTVGGDTNADVNFDKNDLLDIVGASGITTTVSKASNTITLSVDLDDTATDMTATNGGTYGSSTAIPVITVDRQGRLTAASTQAISTTLTIQTDDAVDNGVALASDKLKLLGGDGIVTSNSGDDVTIALSLNELTDTALDVANDSIAFIDATDNTNKKEAVADIITAVAGDGLGASAGVLAVNVDDSSIEIATDTLQVKAAGITNAMLVNDSLTIGSTEIDLGTTATSIDGFDTLHGVDGSGTDAAGSNLTFKAGAGTGTGAGGSILFQTADGAGVSGTGVNSFTTAMTIADDGAVTIAGDLTVNGTTTTVNSNTVEIGDNIILLNRDETGTPSQNAGIEIERGTATNVYLRWNETSDIWQVFEPDPNNSNTLTTANLLTTVNFETQITTLDGGTF